MFFGHPLSPYASLLEPSPPPHLGSEPLVFWPSIFIPSPLWPTATLSFSPALVGPENLGGVEPWQRPSLGQWKGLPEAAILGTLEHWPLLAAFDSGLRAGGLNGIKEKPHCQVPGGPGSIFSHLEPMEMKG